MIQPVRVHHINCGTLRPASGRMVCHCLLVEADSRLVLVDSGFGMRDVERLGGLRPPLDPRGLVQKTFTTLVLRAKFDEGETAVRQVEALGHSPADVTDVVMTHLDSDHAGGLPDFPDARVHVSRAEHEFAVEGVRPEGGPIHNFRYWKSQWEHGPDWVTYDGGGDSWHGFDGVRELDGLPGFLLVPLPGHSPGQCGVAIEVDGRWLLHASDAYFNHREVENGRSAPRAVLTFQDMFEFDGPARADTRARLKELGDDVDFFCAHDPRELDRYST